MTDSDVTTKTSWVLKAGWLCALFLPIVGLIIGITQLQRHRKEALLMIAASLFMSWVFYLLAQQG